MPLESYALGQLRGTAEFLESNIAMFLIVLEPTKTPRVLVN